ncbi:histidine permease [Fusarium falciforme]|uniref:Histidine permease n=1 Tax=Fusarium falciforme TaxID=195108 RepID=A0A9W8V676_9HYPO|nr:AA-permease domain-containing protein [Fusarium falciforme]KAJ4173849.1 histidine permease [Fusarium falciforme]KAJ4196817.1 histidine permease [Fusarium falciforme]KAJ4207899.1 histidine permease [Fusarium falciforme]KAJ4259227.1 histidine permease [Fusarium falciforme]WAO83695.1 AA-permease domain-containing protein [Fusarium falciforme]
MTPQPDVERSSLKMKEESLAPGSSFSMREPDYDDDAPPRYWDRFVDGFKRDRSSSFFTADPLSQLEGGAGGRVHDGVHYYDIQSAMLETANSGLARKLKGRHLQMIAIGGSIGTGLFVASGKALAAGGPASLLLAFSIVGTMLFCTCQALGELAVIFPIAGSFSAWATRFLDPSWGFAMGWNYAMQWLIVLPLEIIAASLTLSYWDESLTRAIFVSVFLIVIIFINMFGVKGYGEAEFIFSIIKVIAVIGFILLGIILNCGGTPDSGYIGGRYWQNPGAFNNGFKGMCSVFVTAAFAFAGTELIGLAAAETANPRKSLPTALKQVFWRITLFYIVALTLVGLLVRYDDPRLVGGESDADAKASPFVIAIEEAGIQVLPSIMNAVIMIAVLSVGNSAVFGSSRTLAALANLNQAPKILGYVDRKGRPLVAIAIAAAFGLIAFLADLPEQGAVLDWLMSISGLSTIITWGSICVCHIRFRRAWAARGRSVSELPFQSQVGVAGSYLGIILNVLVIVAQFWVGAFPIGWKEDSSAEIASNFFHKWVGAPCVLIFFIGHKLYYRTTFVTIQDMDVDTGRRDFNVPILVAQEREERASWPAWKKYYKFLC